MPDQTRRAAAPDYTNAALTMGFVNLFWSLLLISANFGLPAALTIAVFLNYLITRLAHHRARMG
ncbi:hypothetical protein LZG00_15985 [Rhodobacteraceae bacterium LMO-12]|nr:hypothetical protein [Rhodobacteraceae bacterium LMO-JJ12]